MKRQPRILAGTALGLLMASAPLGASPLQGTAAFGPMQRGGTPLIILAQDTPTDQGQGDEEQPRKKKREQQQQTETAPAAQQPAPAAEEQQPRRKKRDQQQQAEQ
ncbi:flagellar motor protein MotB, partial [Mesorhizobium sp. BR1-1-5]|nr:flagellar motor protein MotB [Mesorhizobium sp. BR1-1-5]